MILPIVILCLIGNTFAADTNATTEATTKATTEGSCPEYTKAIEQFAASSEFLQSQLTFDNATDTIKNYVGLLTSLIGIPQAMVDGYSYDDAYAQWPGMVILGKEFPEQGAEIVQIKLEGSTTRTELIRELANQTCGSEVSQTCDCEIVEAIKDDAKLQAQANLLIQFLPNAWFAFQDEWVEVAESNTVEEYLADNKEKLKATIEQKKLIFELYIEMDNNGYSS